MEWNRKKEGRMWKKCLNQPEMEVQKKEEKWAIKSERWKDNNAETPGIPSKCHCHLPRPRQTFYVRD